MTKRKQSDGLTDFGFRWGPIEVVRMCTTKGYRILGITTIYQEVQVSVSPSGKSVMVVQTKRRKAVRAGRRKS